MVYEIKCAWCGKDMGTKEFESSKLSREFENKGLPMVSHSICPRCKKTVEVKYGLTKKGGDEND